MQIKQWEDKHLAHFSYGVLTEETNEIVLIDPARNPEPYLEYATAMGATIRGIIETHPHADFVSGHAELHRLTGADIYTSSRVGAAYPHIFFDEGDALQLGDLMLTSLYTPGHSPDSISVLLQAGGQPRAIFSGDTLFIGDCGRPDLREGAGNQQVTREELAGQMYHTLKDKFLSLPDGVVLYPAHGAGTLCGKGLRAASSSTVGEEKRTNWALQPMTEKEFITALLSDQPFVPHYFPYDVELNRRGAPDFRDSVESVPIGHPVEHRSDADTLDNGIVIIDARKIDQFRRGHLPGSFNLMEGPKFETWLGSIIRPGEPFYLAGTDSAQVKRLIERSAAIGYEGGIREAFVLDYVTGASQELDMGAFSQHPEAYTIVDVRNPSERAQGKPFRDSLAIPLPELRDKVGGIPKDRPVVVHCAGGYRSAAGSSIIEAALGSEVKVYDLGEAVLNFPTR